MSSTTTTPRTETLPDRLRNAELMAGLRPETIDEQNRRNAEVALKRPDTLAIKINPAAGDRSADQGELVAALCKARPHFAKIHKSSKGTHGKYADLESILAAVLPALAEHELDVSFHTEYDNSEQLEGAGGASAVSRFKVAVLTHSSGQWRSSKLEMIVEPPRKSHAGHEINNKMQMVGIASSYARRYVLMDLLALAPDDEDADRLGEQQMSRQQRPRQQLRQQSAPQQGVEDYGSSGNEPPPRRHLPRADAATLAETWLRNKMEAGELGDVISWLLKKIAQSVKKKAKPISKDQRQRLYVRATQAKDWRTQSVKDACLGIFGIETADIGTDVYPLIVAFFETASPDVYSKGHGEGAEKANRKTMMTALAVESTESEPSPPAPDGTLHTLREMLKKCGYSWRRVRDDLKVDGELPGLLAQVTVRQAEAVVEWAEQQQVAEKAGGK